MGRYTPRQTAVMVSATTLALLGASPFAAQARDGKEGRRQSNKESEKRTRRTDLTRRDDDHDEDRDDDHDEDHGSTLPPTVTVAPPTTATTQPPAATTTQPPAATTTQPPAATTTKPPPATPTIRASQAFLAAKIGVKDTGLRMDTTISNDATASAAVSAVITISSAGALPGYMEAKSLTGTWACSAYASKPVSPQKYTCTGTLAAKTSGVITVSAGSAILGTAGQMLIAGVVVTPGGVAAGATAATYV